MVELSLEGRQRWLVGATLRDGLTRFPEAEVELEPAGGPVERGAHARLVFAGLEYALVVARYVPPAEGHEGGRLLLAAAAALAPRYDCEIFSGEEGSTWRAAIESRAALTGPPRLAKPVPAIVADVALAQLLDHLVALEPGWTWNVDPAGKLQVGPPAASRVETQGIVLDSPADEHFVRVSELAPRPGDEAVLPSGVGGLVQSIVGRWHSGRAATCDVVLAETLPAGRRFRPTGTVFWPATVEKVRPLLLRITDEEEPERSWLAQGRLQGLETDEKHNKIDYALHEGDELTAAIPTGGVSLLAPRVYPETTVQPARAYRVRARTRYEAIEGKSIERARELEEFARTKTTKVKERYDIKKA